MMCIVLLLPSLHQYTKLGCLSDPILDDVNDFGVCDEAMAKMGITEPDRMATYMLVAAVLHLGNVAFEDADDVKGLLVQSARYVNLTCC